MIDLEELRKLPFKEKKEKQGFKKFTNAKICIRCKYHQKHTKILNYENERYKVCLDYIYCQIGGFRVYLGSTCDLFEHIEKQDMKIIKKL